MKHFHMPAEWEQQEAILLAWPHHKNDWPGKFGPIPWVYVEIVRHIAARQKVWLVVKNITQEAEVRDYLTRAHVKTENVTYHRIATNRVWTRDSGPTFVRDAKGKRTLLDWKFNAWAKYPNHKLDDALPTQLNKKLQLPVVKPVHKGKRVVLEGGAIDVNGKGALLTTEECLMDAKVQVRNPGFTKEDYEETFARYMGINEVIWLGKGITGDDTHGHIDDLARFTDANTIVTVVESNRKDENYAPLQENVKRLMRTKYNVVELPMPRPLMFEGTRLPASYANFLIINGAVLVPTFHDPLDRVVLNLLAELFPSREIIGIHALDLVWGFGTLHCLSQQVPQK